MSFLILPEGFCKKQIYLFFIYLVSIVSVKKYNVLPSKYGNLSIKKGHKMIMSIVTIRGLYVLYRYPWLQFYRGNFSKFNIYQPIYLYQNYLIIICWLVSIRSRPSISWCGPNLSRSG